jgi:hypothetical protein
MGIDHRYFDIFVTEQGAQCLILCLSGNMMFLLQVYKKSLNFWCAHLFWMSLLVKNDVAFNPIDVGLLGTIRVMLDPQSIAHLIK